MIPAFQIGQEGLSRVPTDPKFGSVSMLLQYQLINGTGNFYDTSIPGRSVGAVSKNGTPVLETTQGKFSGYSGRFGNGATNGLYLASTTGLDLTTGDFTLETFVYFNSIAAQQYLLCKQTSTGLYPWRLTYDQASGKMQFVGFDTGSTVVYNITGTTTIATGQWYHVVGSRNGNTVRLLVNGASEGTATTASALRSNSGDSVYIAQSGAGSAGLNGWLNETRITKGVDRYGSGYTVPNEPFATT